MLPEQASGTNITASTMSPADPSFDNIFSSADFAPIGHHSTPETTKIEQYHMTNQGYQAIEQQIRREAQQQHNMARPGPPNVNYNDLIREIELDEIRAALAADAARESPFQSQMRTELERPATPEQKFNSCHFPITPDSSPFTIDDFSHAMARSRTFDATPIKSMLHPTSVSECVNRGETMRRSSSYPNNKSSLEADFHRIMNTEPSPPASAGLAPPSAFFPDLSAANVGLAADCEVYDSSNYSPLSSALTPLMSSFESSPELTGMSLFGKIGNVPAMTLPGTTQGLPTPQSSQSNTAYASPPKESIHRRNQSVVTVESIDGTNEETGITEDEISLYISGPLHDNKYMCTYEDCNKLFGRKENIRSHVQTHLGDRQWRCNHCHKRFVRQHDLKRHAKIHTGQKPHQCPCGNGFARHDALTRHRQRNTCIGGFGVAEGIPQSPSKRGRPKKRPDIESRRDKATKTRERALEKASASSVSGSSVYSAPSPEMFFEELATSSMRNPNEMVTIQSVEGDEALEAINALTPEMVEEYFNDMSKDSSPFSEFEAANLFGADKNAFDMEPTFDSTSQWLL